MCKTYLTQKVEVLEKTKDIQENLYDALFKLTDDEFCMLGECFNIVSSMDTIDFIKYVIGKNYKDDYYSAYKLNITETKNHIIISLAFVERV